MRNPSALVRLKDADENGAFERAKYVDVYDKTDIVMYIAGVDHFYIALLSALRQTHCALVTSDSD